MSATTGPLGTTGGAAASSFAPTDIAGLQLWLKADSLALSDGTGVSSWSDSSGNGNTASQGTGANQPLFKTNIINGLPVVRFDGVNDFMTVTRNAGLEPNNATIFMLVQGSAAPALSSYLLSKKITIGTSSSFSIQHGATSATGIRSNCRVATTGVVTGTTGLIADSGVWNSLPRIVVAQMDGSSMKFGFPTNVLSSQTAVGNLFYDANDLIIGAYDPTQLYAAFDLAALLIYDSALSIANVVEVIKYMANRWAVSP